MATIFYAHDAHPDALKRKTIAVFGYGSQGHAQALNLRESGYNVIIGLDPARGTAQRAREDGFEVVAPAEAAKRADYLQILTPDETQSELYEEFIRPYLTKGKVLGFSHGFSIHFKTIVPPPDVDVVMIAPKSPGHLVRRQYTEGRGVPALIAIYPGCQRQGARACPGLCRRHRFHPRRSSADHLQGRDRERPLRRAGRSLRRTHLADQEGL